MLWPHAVVTTWRYRWAPVSGRQSRTAVRHGQRQESFADNISDGWGWWTRVDGGWGNEPTGDGSRPSAAHSKTL